ncbi:hypothetical protein EB796_015148 [Bugula neritina]|uniref:Uncharacterized protein n=1 Tax=Bugula neritina TaxID=10212 RepID=A0A7J7JMB4_BUGNE|nr:hypothetical protein EB796_015148 [Bugula neritina]
MSAVGGGDGALTADNVAAVNVGEESDNALTSMCIDEVVESDNALMAENLTAVDAAEVVLAEQMMQPCDTTVHAGLSRFSDVPDTGDGLEVITEETV